MLSENDIKRAFQPFLKEFYKYRYEYQPGSLQGKLDNISAGGIIADGMVTFRKVDGSMFVSTYEATSADKAEEVRFRLNRQYLTWDCLAFGAVFATVVYGSTYIYDLPWLMRLSWFQNFAFVFGTGILGSLLWILTFKRLRKYRYIYAIEQFKQYFADEQWIALAEDVFPAVTDRHFDELKRQCIHEGVGLALLSEKGEVRVLNAPSRLGSFGKHRKMIHWLTKHKVYQTMAENVSTLAQYRPALPEDFGKQWSKVKPPVGSLPFKPNFSSFWEKVRKFSWGKTDQLNRYMRGHSVQKWVFTAALLAVVPLVLQVRWAREDTVWDIANIPEAATENPLVNPYQEPVKQPEPSEAPDVYTEPVITTINLSDKNDQEDVPTIDLSGGIEEEPAPSSTPDDAPCAPHLSRRAWVILDNSFLTKKFADERATALGRMGIDNEVFAKKCVGEGAGYFLRIGPISTTEAEATRQAQNFTKALERYGLLQQTLQVRRIN